MRLILWLIWIVLGFCLFVSGCRASISAGNLEAAFTIGAPGVVAPDIQQVGHDESSN